jgi:hypothetical protein
LEQYSYLRKKSYILLREFDTTLDPLKFPSKLLPPRHHICDNEMARLTSIAALLAASKALAYTIPPSQKPLEEDDTPLPVVIWHGLGDNFQNDGLKEVASLIEEVNEGTLTYIIHLADDGSAEYVLTSPSPVSF